MNDYSLTAAVEGSAEQDLRVQTEGVRYWIANGKVWVTAQALRMDSIDILATDSITKLPKAKGWAEGNAFRDARIAELVRRANALPTAQAQLAEAVELLRQSASGIQASHENYGALFGDDHEQPESPEIVTAIRAFLAKQP